MCEWVAYDHDDHEGRTRRRLVHEVSGDDVTVRIAETAILRFEPGAEGRPLLHSEELRECAFGERRRCDLAVCDDEAVQLIVDGAWRRPWCPHIGDVFRVGCRRPPDF